MISTWWLQVYWDAAPPSQPYVSPLGQSCCKEPTLYFPWFLAMETSRYLHPFSLPYRDTDCSSHHFLPYFVAWKYDATHLSARMDMHWSLHGAHNLSSSSGCTSIHSPEETRDAIRDWWLDYIVGISMRVLDTENTTLSNDWYSSFSEQCILPGFSVRSTSCYSSHTEAYNI